MAVQLATTDGKTMTPSQSGQQSPHAHVTEPPFLEGGCRRTVTAGQVSNAITQLRARRGQSAALQILAVLRALDLTVVPDPEKSDVEPECPPTPGPCVACVGWISGANRPGRHTCW
jgi:hypothetical protein